MSTLRLNQRRKALQAQATHTDAVYGLYKYVNGKLFRLRLTTLYRDGDLYPVWCECVYHWETPAELYPINKGDNERV